MNIRNRLLCIIGTVAILGGVALIGAPAGAVTQTFNVGNDKVTCNTLSGTITFATALKNSGPTTGANSIKVAGAVAGCTDDSNTNVKMFKGAITSTINTTNGHNCSGLLGPSTVTGTARIIWTPATGQAFTPTVTVGTAQKPVSDIGFSAINAGVFTPPTSETPWASAYGKFQLGAAYGVSPLSIATDFTGGNGGATGWFEGVTQEDVGNILNLCGSAAGLKTVHFGIGAVGHQP